MYSNSTSKFRFLSFSILLTSFLFVILFGVAEPNGSTNVSAATAISKEMPSLNGEKAKEHLKKEGLYESLGEAMKVARYSIYPTKNAPLPDTKEAFEAKNPSQAFSTYFAKDGIHLVSKAKNNKWRVQMNLKGYGYGKNITEVEQTKTEVQKEKSHIEITKSAINNPKSAITEWYKNSASGLEQGWTIKEKLVDSTNGEQLSLKLELGGDLQAKLAADVQAIHFKNKKGETILHYDKLKSWDANGKELPSKMELDNQTLSVVVDDTNAKYPITVDPLFSQTKKLVASDADYHDEFGISVAISGDTVIVGAPGDDFDYDDMGSAYIFERNNGGSDAWGEVRKIVPNDHDFGDYFGYSVAISQDTAIIGASDSAYIFERNSGGANMWGQVQKLSTKQWGNVGNPVAISGDTAIVGATDYYDDGSRIGSVYIYERNIGGLNMWGQVQKLFASDVEVSNSFGNVSIAISGDTIIIGAYNDNDRGSNSGAAYIFERNSGGANMWDEVQKLFATDTVAGDVFGISVAISGNTIIVGAVGDDDSNDDSGKNIGSAYIFERNSSSKNMWGQVQKIAAHEPVVNDTFGFSVGISEDTAIVGAWRNIDGGSAYIFERNSSGMNIWGQVRKVAGNDTNALDEFGHTVAISGDTAIVGAWRNGIYDGSKGAAYIFKASANPTAASVSGRVTTNTGRGIGRTSVSMDNLNGETFTTRTNQFGYFKFDNALVGETYTLTVKHKVYSFEPSSQAINVGGDITGISFTGYTKSDFR